MAKAARQGEAAGRGRDRRRLDRRACVRGLTTPEASKRTNLLVILNDNNMAIDRPREREKPAENLDFGALTVQNLTAVGADVAYAAAAAALPEGGQRAVKQGLLNKSNFRKSQFRYFGRWTVQPQGVGADASGVARHRGAKLLHVMTVKGKGLPAGRHDQPTWHARGVSIPTRAGGFRLRAARRVVQDDHFGETLLELARRDRRVVGVAPCRRAVR